MIVNYLNVFGNSLIALGDGGGQLGTAKTPLLADYGRPAMIQMLGWDWEFWYRPQVLDGTVETTDHDIGRLLEEVNSHD